ncbi:hypothetical protein M413DRAFT_9028 [Hebeloma cylindrosporum]|uniref:Transcription factor BYE1 n=1 Tax=Hebeloma cylindrosporum TaxID=76867 RepID=A0A0C2YUP9_HEBCY|nr:hypothetical protein M413DRAFT_9028 [Hebeloma cylindrosporum h7]
MSLVLFAFGFVNLYQGWGMEHAARELRLQPVASSQLCVMTEDLEVVSWYHAAKAKVRGHRARSAQADDMDVDLHSLNGKENLKSTAIKQGKREKARKKLVDLDCVCSKGNDGSPMVYCASCRIWYHFTCVDLTEPEAEEISVYICPTCTSSCGRHTALVWEGDGAIEEESDDESAIVSRRKLALNAHKTTPDVKEESEEEESSEDEYLERDGEIRAKQGQRNRRLRRFSTPSDSESADESSKRRLRRAKVSSSPSPSVSGQLKRKSAHSNLVQSSPPPSKRKKSGSRHESQSPADDPARKYCLGKLEELFRDIFLRYPHIKDAGGTIMAKKLEELTDEEKDALVNESRQFATELESCVFEIYSEPDKAGQPHAGGKYKDRFRMLQFNLSKVDRVNIHRRITSGNISPKEISLMSSTDLADEETKQSIMLAEKEALEYSILLKSTAPRAKITHKGLQDIEDVNGEVASAHEIERHREREQADEERREKERMARLRVQRQRTASMSAPPESPVVQQSPSSAEQPWGAPPPVPAHAMSPKAAGADEFVGGMSRLPSFVQAPEENAAEPEMNLADLINIDDDETSTPSANVQSQVASMSIASPTDTAFPPPTSTMPTGISPFAARSDRASFDLNSLWSAPKEESLPADSSVSAVAPAEEPQAEGSDKDDAMELESVDEANDQDFDMFLEDKEEKSQEPIEEFTVTPIIPKNVETLPTVWTGKITMPLDSSVPQETSLVARQVAGKPLAPNSVLWKTLFPSDQLRIEGRVPVENSIKYLLQMRLNATKELYAAAFVPASLTHEEDFKIFSNFLISKSRHGLVFPWGSRPKEYHPGRELYMIPLLQSEPLPEFIQLLDELKLPETRSRDYLIGIWILNKGKLAPLPGAPTQSSTPPIANQPPQPAQPPQPPPLTQTPPLNVPYNPSPPVPQLLPKGIPSLPPAIPGLPIAPAALAAEVASLTPEQLQEVLRTLASTTQIALPPPPQPQPALPQPPPFLQNRPPPHMPNPPLTQHTPPVPQAWMQQPPPPPFPISFPPSNVPNFQQPPPQGMNPLRPPSRPPYDREYDRDYDREYDRDFRPGPHYPQTEHGHRGERGWHGNPQRGGGRGGRGRGRGDGQDFSARRDSGWPRRSRNEGQGGGPNW